jgi:hypothetical protein
MDWPEEKTRKMASKVVPFFDVFAGSALRPFSMNRREDADLGGQVLKNRAGLHGRGKCGGTRVIVATERKHREFFLYGFGKK